MRPRQQGMTLVEIALSVSVVGILLAVAVPTFVKHVRTSKVAEATEQLQRLSERTMAYYRRTHEGPEGKLLHCLPPAAGPTPAEASVQTAIVDFGAPDVPGAATWSALDFLPQEPVRYRYSFTPAKSGCDVRAEPGEVLVTFRAEGDLDGDGVLSTFERSLEATAKGELTPHTLLFIEDRIE